MNKETFCSFPFDTIFLGADSGVKTCCSARTDLGNLNNNSIETILNSNTAQSVRDSIINNQWHPQCSQCKEIELMGGRSERSTNVENNYDSYVPIQLDKTYFNIAKDLEQREAARKTIIEKLGLTAEELSALLA